MDELVQLRGTGRRAGDRLPRWAKAAERIGLGGALAFVLVGLVASLVAADREDRRAERDAFLAALAKNTAAVERLAGAEGEAQAVYRALCEPLPVLPLKKPRRSP